MKFHCLSVFSYTISSPQKYISMIILFLFFCIVLSSRIMQQISSSRNPFAERIYVAQRITTKLINAPSTTAKIKLITESMRSSFFLYFNNATTLKTAAITCHKASQAIHFLMLKYGVSPTTVNIRGYNMDSPYENIYQNPLFFIYFTPHG